MSCRGRVEEENEILTKPSRSLSLLLCRSKRDEKAEKEWLKNNPGGDIKTRRFVHLPSLVLSLASLTFVLLSSRNKQTTKPRRHLHRKSLHDVLGSWYAWSVSWWSCCLGRVSETKRIERGEGGDETSMRRADFSFRLRIRTGMGEECDAHRMDGNQVSRGACAAGAGTGGGGACGGEFEASAYILRLSTLSLTCLSFFYCRWRVWGRKRWWLRRRRRRSMCRWRRRWRR